MSKGTQTWTRREVAGFMAATIGLAGCRTAGSRPLQTGTASIDNTGTLLEAADATNGGRRISSLRSRSSSFEWLADDQLFRPLALLGRQPATDWHPEPVANLEADLSLSALSSSGFRAQLQVRSFGDSGAFLWRQSYRNTTRSTIASVRAISALDLDLRGGLGGLAVHCVRRDSDYSREALPFRDHLEIAGGQWNAPKYTGLVILEARPHSEFLVIGIQQEHGWVLSLDMVTERIRLRVRTEDMQRDVPHGQVLEAPAIFLGACKGTLDDAVNVALTHLRARVLPPPLAGTPWVSYDIWSTDAANVEENILEEIPFAARLGVELFYLDASWYRDSSRRGTGDWGKGLGSYTEDRIKFPRGLRHLSDQVHAAGMKFGLWVGPNVVDSTLVPAQIPEAWLATVDGSHRELNIDSWEHKLVQVCLGAREYAEHLKHELTRLVREYNLDWLKWDNSGIPGVPAACNRPDHGHLPEDGSATALINEYAVFRHLREAFPNLTIEQCGYGSRLDYGLAPFVRANWCSDTTFPSERVRANAMACATVFPSSCNASWIVREDQEFFAADAPFKLDAGIRSRMIGLFGVGTLNGQMSQRASLYPAAVLERLAANIMTYKRYRHLLSQRVSFPFPPYGRSPQGWESVQFTDESGTDAVVICFRGASTQAESALPLAQLRAAATYVVVSEDSKIERKLTGAELMESGLLAHLGTPGSSDIFHLRLAS